MTMIPPSRQSAPGGPRGAIIVITLLALILLASLVFYVLNLGQQTNERLVTQHSADAAAAAGAGYVARTFNTVALNNTGMAQLLAGVPVMDAMPQAVLFAWRDQTSLLEVLERQIPRPIAGPLGGWWVTQGLERLRDEVRQEVETLEPMHGFLNESSFDMRQYTYYAAPDGQMGVCWRAIQAMDEYSQTAVETLGELAQVSASRGGAVNLARSRAFMLPLIPHYEMIRRGEFDDFERPVRFGLLKEGTDDKLVRRGPYDVLFGWRERNGAAYGHREDGASDISRRWHGATGLNRPAGDGGRFVVDGYGPPTQYSVYGPFKWTLDRVNSFSHARLHHSRFARYVNQMANVKLAHCWGGSFYTDTKPTGLFLRGYRLGELQWEISVEKDYRYWFDGRNLLQKETPSNYYYLEDGVNYTSDDLILEIEDLGDGFSRVTYIGERTDSWSYDVIGADGEILLQGLGEGVNGRNLGLSALFPTPTKDVIEPVWITDFVSAKAVGDDVERRKEIKETRFVAVEIKSKHPPTHPDFMAEGTWTWDKTADSYNPRVLRVYGWMDPTRWTAASVSKVSDHIWRDVWSYEVTYDNTIGVTAVDLDGDGVNDPQTVYRIDDFVFAGINIGPRISVGNPFNFETRQGLPAPTDFDPTQITHQEADRRQYLTFLGLARKDDQAMMWPAKFAGGKPYGNKVALAQTQVFNNHSWDLWTQMWHAQLVPVDQYDQWVTGMTVWREDLALAPSVAAGDYDNLYRYLRALSPLAATMLRH